MRFAFLPAFLVLVAQAACRGGAPPESPRPAPATSGEAVPGEGAPTAATSTPARAEADAGPTGDLARFCGNGGGCGDYEAELAALRARASAPGRACFVAERGSCGAYRYLDEVPGGLLGVLRYFDASGKLVSVTQYNVEHPGRTSFGAAVACPRAKLEDLCPKPASP